MYDARLFTDKLPEKITKALKEFSGNECYLIKREVDRKSFLSNKNNCHQNVQRYVEKFGGERLNGWLLYRNEQWIDEMGLWVWHYHSVWITPKNKIVDVTDNDLYKKLPLSTFIPDTTRKVDLENGIAYNTIVIFDNIRAADKFAGASGEDRKLFSGVVYWTTNNVQFFRALDEHGGQYKLIRKEYPQNLEMLEKEYNCKASGGKLVPNDPNQSMIPSEIFFDYSLGGG
jgi:hypothetical protein